MEERRETNKRKIEGKREERVGGKIRRGNNRKKQRKLISLNKEQRKQNRATKTGNIGVKEEG